MTPREGLRCKHRHLWQEHKQCFNSDGTLKETTNFPKIACLDIETLPILGYTWNVWNTNIYSNQVVKDWCVLGFSAKWFGSDKIISDVLTPKEAIIRDDSRLVSNIWKLLEEASVIVTHNGKRFDIRKINTRFWKNGLGKPSSYKIIDTLVTAKQVFGLTYNKLDFIAQFLGLQEKLETDFDLWVKCDSGDKESLKYMREYNENDVIMQEEIYLKMREWIPNHPDMSLYTNLSDVCPVCLSSKYKEIGLYTSNRRQYKEYRCVCGSVWHDTKSI